MVHACMRAYAYMQVRDARIYAAVGEWLSFWDIAARARARGDVAMGFKRMGGEVVLNRPTKSEQLLWGAVSWAEWSHVQSS